MKKSVIAFSVVLLLTLVTTSIVVADLPGGSWWSALFYQNIGSDGGSANMTAYDNTTSYGSDTFAFNFGKALIYDPGKTPNYPTNNYVGFSTGLPGGFEGAVVLQASVPVAAVSEIANYTNGSVGGGGTAAARYQGMGPIATGMMVPTIKNNFVGQTTTLYVQAAGADADVTVFFNMNDGTPYSQNVVIDANEMFIFDPTNAGVPSSGCGYNANVSPCYGSAEIVTASGPIAANVVEHPHKGSPIGYALSTRAQSEDDMDAFLYHPSVKNNYWGQADAGASIMNVGLDTALVRITLTVTNVDNDSSANIGDIYTGYEVVEPGGAAVFSKWRDNLGGLPEGTFAAAVVESITGGEGGYPDTYTIQPLIGSTNDRKVMPSIPGGTGLTLYYGFADQNKTQFLAAPIVREKVNGITGSLTVQNVGTAPTYIRFEYYEYGTDNVYVFETKDTIAVGEATVTTLLSQKGAQRFNIIDGFTSWSELAGKQFSAIVYSDAPVIGLASEYAIADTRDISNYEAFNIEMP